ncbi:thioredoxin family protein [Aliikangiella sp. G2MR2-5]|uniref:TlpA family protein disulfide reductase n=1 Tax=Aliikangiella sp. G2MR2-5 TaxID=2788943 RepID=UPI0018A935A7|nr:redoxin domain-containing protein [Aliikangiella sp. G2MR2-5]
MYTNVLVFLLLFFGNCFAAWAKTDSRVALVLPSVDIQGKAIGINEFIGKKPVYLKLWASWCVPCNEQMPHFVEAHQQYGDKIEFVSVNIDINDDAVSVNNMIEQYGMKMPTVVDANGKIAATFDLPGTPLHLLLNTKGQLVHRGHKVDALLNRRLDLLAREDSAKTEEFGKELLKIEVFDAGAEKKTISLPKTEWSALYFSATWCDWYLTESRPEQSRNCISGQKGLNRLNTDFPEISFKAIVSRLWTSQKEVEEYRKRYQSVVPTVIDTNNQTFLKYSVNKLPTLLIFKNGQEVERFENFQNKDVLKKQIDAILEGSISL